jgi:ATP-binding cassette subfamily B protein
MAAMGVMRFFLYMFVGIKVYYKAFSVGKFIQYVGAVEQLVSNATNMFIYFGILLNNAAYIEDIYTYCSHAETAVSKDGDVSEGTIRFSNVYYRYRTSDRDILKNVDLELKEGKKYAIVGENGSGKTTFVKLLCGLYKPTSGVVSMNGTDVSTVSPTRYYDKFSVVFQDFSLVSASVGENVACDMDQDRDRVYSALDKAGFSERLSKMAKGTDTVIYREYDETGEEISGGEAQKIALARAVYKDSPYVILDEPTASLDPVSEEEIYSRVNEMNSDKTVFFVSHRLSSCKFCDEILVFDNGSIVQRGSHEKLLSEKGSKYFSLWNAQAQYYV